MAMSRRFFQKLADEMKSNKPQRGDYGTDIAHAEAMSVWGVMVLGTARTIQSEAPSFDRARFLHAADFPVDVLQRE